jgi:hypothetical protein
LLKLYLIFSTAILLFADVLVVIVSVHAPSNVVSTIATCLEVKWFLKRNNKELPVNY